MTTNNAVNSIYHEKSKFILIGLTGRTGSGCSTAANILEGTEPQTFPDPENVIHNGSPFFKNLDLARYRILHNYIKTRHEKFVVIRVSDIISMFILITQPPELMDFINNTKQTDTQKKNLIEQFLDKDKKKYATTKRIINQLITSKNEQKQNQHTAKKILKSINDVRDFSSQFKEFLRNLDAELYVKIYQDAGDSIRKTGSIKSSHETERPNPEAIFTIPKIINKCIKAIRFIKNGKAFIALDAIRNPYEAKFFRDRYAAFYLISINTPEEKRKNYLLNNHNYTIDDLKRLDKRESGKSHGIVGEFISQNIKKCIEISDIHLFNPRSEEGNTNVLRAQLGWYLALMRHPGLTTPTAQERVMQAAFTAKFSSGCISRQVGAVITDSHNSIKATGWNDVPAGQVPCNLRSLPQLLQKFDRNIYSDYELNEKDFRIEASKELAKYDGLKEVDGLNLSYCFKDLRNSIKEKENNQVHTRALHAEENAFLQIVKYGGQGIEGGKLYTTAFPCELCAKKAYQLGIKEIIFIDPYPGISRTHILEIGSNRPSYTPYIGSIGKSFHTLYEQSLAYKDELEFIKISKQ